MFLLLSWLFASARKSEQVLSAFQEVPESAEQGKGIVGTGRGLRMKLHGKGHVAVRSYAFHRVIIKIPMGDAYV